MIAALLTGESLPPEVSSDLYQLLLLRGSILTLQTDGSQEAVDILQNTVRSCANADIQQMALDALCSLSVRNQLAAQAMFTLAIHQASLSAQKAIQSHRIHAPSPIEGILFAFLTTDVAQYRKLDPGQIELTLYFLTEADSGLQNRILTAARTSGFDNWILLVTSVQTDSTDSYHQVIQHYQSMKPEERELALAVISEKAGKGSEFAQEALCELYIQHEDANARSIAVQQEYQPRDTTRSALFFFLTEQWERYEKLDFSHTLLNAAYESAAPALRRRLLSQSRYSGQVAWLQVRPGTSRQRWLKDLTDMDWQSILSQLKTAKDYQGLWRLAQVAPPVKSAAILDHLRNTDFKPSNPAEHDIYTSLLNLSAKAIQNQLQIPAGKTLQAITSDVSALAISPGGKVLASAGSDQIIHLWQLPQGEYISTPIYGPAPQTRALVFSHDGQYLVCSSGDNAIRVFRTADNKLVKTLEGHTSLVRSLALHPDGRTLFSAGFDGTLRAWRFPLGPEQAQILRANEEIFGMVLSANGQAILSAGSDREISVWSWPEGTLLRQLHGHTATITSLAISSTGQLAASASRDKTIRVWNFASGKQLQLMNSGDHPITALVIHPTEMFLLSASYNGKITLWNVASGKPLIHLDQHTRPITALTITADGNTLLSSSADGKISLFRLDHFLMAHQPIEAAHHGQSQTLQALLSSPSLPNSDYDWLAFRLELIQWKERFDIEVGEPHQLQFNEFDIELD